MAAPPSILITGANRGIGLGLAREFVQRGWRVFAACRSPDRAAELNRLPGSAGGKVEILPLEVRDPASLAALVKAVSARTASLEVLVNNAGVHPARREEKIGHLTLEAIADTIAVNTLGPIAVTQAFLPLLRAGRAPKVAHISSGAGSLKSVITKGHYGYSISKAALNMFMRRASVDLQPMGITTVSFSPGWVKTDMGGMEADIGLDEAVAVLARSIESITPEQNGQWLDRFGKTSEFAW